jgi:hypothetical protein
MPKLIVFLFSTFAFNQWNNPSIVFYLWSTWDIVMLSMHFVITSDNILCSQILTKVLSRLSLYNTKTLVLYLIFHHSCICNLYSYITELINYYITYSKQTIKWIWSSSPALISYMKQIHTTTKHDLIASLKTTVQLE